MKRDRPGGIYLQLRLLSIIKVTIQSRWDFCGVVDASIVYIHVHTRGVGFVICKYRPLIALNFVPQ